MLERRRQLSTMRKYARSRSARGWNGIVPIGDRARLDYPPAARAKHVMGAGELVEQARLADPGLADHRDDLARPCRT